MARIDDLISRVGDGALQADLTDAVNELRRTQRFGLVFERHIPETTALMGLPVTVGAIVQVRSEPQPAGGEYTVKRIIGGNAELEPTGDAVAHAPVSIDDLMVVKRFGDPIFPTLTRVGGVTHGERDCGEHAVVNAENFHALQLLGYLYENQVDCIYIDPPYNTGARDWKYNNSYVDVNDGWRHSKWLSFMEKRLQLAKRLLTDDGVLVVTIDEKEVHNLGVLLAQVFPGAARQMVTIVINPLGQARKQELARVEEYAFFVFLGESAPNLVADDLLTEAKTSKRAGQVRWEWLIRGGTHSARHERPNLFYPIYVDPTDRRVVEVGDALPKDTDRNSIEARDGVLTVWPLNANGVEGNWRCSPDYLRELLDKGYAKVGAYDRKNDRYSFLYLGKAQIRRIEAGAIRVVGNDPGGAVQLEGDNEAKRVTAKTVWSRLSHRAGEYGSSLVKRLVPGREFPFPKSLYAVADTLRIAVGDRPDALILDFFAGSGTTAHAAMLLNSGDGGTRRTVMVTNNEVSADESTRLRKAGHAPGDAAWEERGIFEHITRPRVEAAATGITHIGERLKGNYLNGNAMGDGFPENVGFYQLRYLDPDEVDLGRQWDAIHPLVWMSAGSVGPYPEPLGRDAHWVIPDGCRYAVLLKEGRYRQFRDALEKRPGVTHVWLVTDSEDAYRDMIAGLPSGLVTSMMYRDYLKNFKINTDRTAAP